LPGLATGVELFYSQGSDLFTYSNSGLPSPKTGDCRASLQNVESYKRRYQHYQKDDSQQTAWDWIVGLFPRVRTQTIPNWVFTLVPPFHELFQLLETLAKIRTPLMTHGHSLFASWAAEVAA
jgi:hypothetical protein